MSKVTIQVRQIAGPLPAGTVIVRTVVDQLLGVADFSERARKHAATVLEQAQGQLDKAREEAILIKENAYREGVREAEASIEHAKRQAIDEAVQWLIQESELEHRIVSGLEQKIRHLIAKFMTELLGRQDNQELLLQQITQRIPGLIRNGQLELRVHPRHWTRITAEYADEASIHVVADNNLSPSVVILDSSLVQIRLDLHQHQQLLLQQFKNSNYALVSYEQD